MAQLNGKTVLITGASRGIGREIALRLAQDGANLVIAAKTSQVHAKLEGTIHETVQQIEQGGGRALASQMDIRFPEQIEATVALAAQHFGGIDILINNASAIYLTSTEQTSPKQFDLMHQVNTRGTYLCSKACLPWLEKSENPHILNLSPPLNMNPKWFKPYVAYTMAKYGMSMCVLGMAGEFASKGIGVNALWPKTTIATAAIERLMGQPGMNASRKPQILADAAHAIVHRDSRTCSGNFFIDEEVLASEGVTDFEQYRVCPDTPLATDLFLDD